MKSVVTIGGGTGQFGLLSGLKKYPVRLTAIVSMMDDGGSTGKLRDELGVLPPGDIRQCLVALAGSDVVMRELFNYRFDSGGLSGHSFGNIFLSALEKITGSFEEAVRLAGMVLNINGEVIPVTTLNADLVCGEGPEKLCGEHAVNTAPRIDPDMLRLEPEAYANPKAMTAIETADCIVIGPGNLYCSIVPNLLVRGISEAIGRSKAKVVYNCNLMTKVGHTEGYAVGDFVRAIEQHIGKGRVDFVTYNTGEADAELLTRYAGEGEFPVRADLVAEGGKNVCEPPCTALPGDLISRGQVVQKSYDAIKRSLIRHDQDRLAATIVQNCLGGV
jgi:uncharacterized cofD-like protein